MRPLLVLVGLCFVCAGHAHPQNQKHILPTVAQCRADATAWNKEENAGPKDKMIGFELPNAELVRRQKEMMDCLMIEAERAEDGTVVRVRASYKTLYHFYISAQFLRYEHFLERHNLLEKFLEEDQQGLR